jgi:hypothetical protein
MAGGRAGRGMNVRLHIDRLVLDGIDLAGIDIAADRPRLKAAIEQELARLIGAGGISPELAGGVALPSVRAQQIALAPDAKPAQLGAAIAGAVYGGVGGTR